MLRRSYRRSSLALLCGTSALLLATSASAQTGGTVIVPRGGAPVPTPIAGGGSAAGGANVVVPTQVQVVQTPTTPIPAQAAAITPVEEGPRFTLTDALNAMGRGHPLLIAAQSAIRAADRDVVAAGLWTNPQLTVNYTRTLVQPGSNSMSGAYDPTLGYTQLGVSQLLELSNLPGARRRAAELTRNATRQDGEAVRRGLIYDVYSAFVSLTATAERLDIAREHAAQLERADQIVRARVDAGAAPHYDASRIAIALADARAAVGDAQADLASSRADLDIAVGPYASSLHGLPQFDLYNLPPLQSQETMTRAARENRPDIVAARDRAQAAGAQIDVARRQVFQGITLYLGGAVGGGNPTGMGNEGPPQVDITAGLTIPLPLVDRGQGTVPAAQARAGQANATSDALTLQAEQRIAAVYREVSLRRDALAAYRDAGVAQSAGMRREAEAGYREGRLSVLELVDAYTSYRDARLRLVSLANDARQAEVNLGRSTGVLP